ncbi:MAG: phage/plasmid-like protein (TIGR03299 family) [Nitrospinales bacterium]|jgi:phage/plasmid-like protein (TIGR03299 family)
MNLENEKLWAGIGVEVNSNLSSREMLYKAKLDWEVSKIPSQRPKSHANQETLRFYKAYFDCGNAEIETVGSLDGARIIWSLARLNEDFVLPGRDELKGYILLASRHEDREKIEIHFLTLRSASNSMLKISSKARPTVKNSFRRSFKSTLPFLSESSLQFDEDMIERTKKTIEMGRTALSAHAKEAQLLAEKKVTEQIAENYMTEVFKQDSEDSEEAKQKANANALSALDAFGNAPGQNLESAQMTAWGLLTAVTYTADRLGKTPDSRLRQAWFGPNAKIKKRALELALKLL